MKIGLEQITKGTMQALVGLPTGGLHSMEKPSTVILTKYFGEYSLDNKAYRTQGDNDALF